MASAGNTPASPPTAKSGSIWDNDLPAGDSPPLARWPLTVSVALYVLWMIFLISMMVLRLAETAH